jgi:hypothetical protein
MGYSTEFSGHFTITPPLNAAEVDYLRKFSDSRRFRRDASPDGAPYAVEPSDFTLTGSEAAELRASGGNYNGTPDGQPGLWCDWWPTTDGTAYVWNGSEKTYASAAWLRYLIEHFLGPDGAAKGQPGFEAFTFDHVLNGVVQAQGDDGDDRWALIIEDNTVEEGV